MPCYFVSNGVEMSMTNQTFDVIWNGFRNKELNGSDTSSSSDEGGKTCSSGEKTGSAEWRKQDRTTDTTTENRTTNFFSKDITKRKRNSRAYAIYAVLP